MSPPKSYASFGSGLRLRDEDLCARPWVSMSTTYADGAAMERLFKIAQQTPLNIAPERGVELASRIISADTQVIERSNEPAQFFAIPEDKANRSKEARLSPWDHNHISNAKK